MLAIHRPSHCPFAVQPLRSYVVVAVAIDVFFVVELCHDVPCRFSYLFWLGWSASIRVFLGVVTSMLPLFGTAMVAGP